MTARIGLLLLAPALFAQPHLQNGRLETRAVNGSLDATFHMIAGAQAGPVWIAYSIAQAVGSGWIWTECGTVRLEGVTDSFLFYRVEGGRVERIRIFPADCMFDSGGYPVYWLTGVDGVQSVGLLKSLIPAATGREERRLGSQALSAIAQHRDGIPALIEIARDPGNRALRSQAMSALGRSKDSRAIKFFEDVLASR